jgi:hypothetical protein
LKQKALKTGHFAGRPESVLGAGALPFVVYLDSTAYKPALLNLEETLATISTAFDCGQRVGPFAKVLKIGSKTDIAAARAHLPLRQLRVWTVSQ